MPVVKQLSIFLENKPGVLARLCENFAKEGINIEGLSVADGVDHAVVRLVPSDPRKAREMLESTGVLCIETDVIALKVPDRPGELGAAAKRLAKANVNIDYAYGTAAQGEGMLILRVNDLKKARKALKDR
jgi:hypothetical protein